MSPNPGRVAAFLTSLNTHRSFWVGVGFGIPSVLAIGARDVGFDLWATAHLDGFAVVARAFVDGAADAGLVAVIPAILAAAFGRPPNIPGAPR